MPTSSPVPIDQTPVTHPPAAVRRAEAADPSRVEAARPRTSPVPPATGWTRARAVLGAYVALTKPRIIELLLVTTLPTMILAEGGFPSVGLVLGALSLTWFAAVVNGVAALLTAAAMLVYVVGYTMILKRRTPQNIVWGGIAGCMPVLIGWSAVTGSVGWAPVALFGVIFFWTPPHYWPLSMKFRRDYAAAGVPMLPVVAGDRRVASEVILYALAMVACSLALVPLASMTWVYTVAAVALGGWFVAGCVGLYRRAQRPGTVKLGEMKLFHLSITYLTLLFLAVAVDPFLPF